MVRPLNAAMCPRRNPDSFNVVRMDHHLHVVILGNAEAVVDCRGVVPQSSCSFHRAGAGLQHSSSAAGRDALPLQAMPRLIGKASNDWIMRAICHGPGVQVVANVPCEGPVPPRRSSVVTAGHQRNRSICCGQMKMDVAVEAAGGEDLALAGDGRRCRAR